ncbi:hypothetical protein DAVIS_04161 [Mycobacterium marinum]|uniref:Uncharacterized protein n=1 Tax=Mycobacterium marinum TaxID=1781 RepID=A0A3E2MRJ4_MYCMR|nr:hypothetical protein DAVIS_04161 [Mycobacterium marinum]GJO45795.1 hypothetical protein NJB1604_25240 [Mycobacterium marinum]
MLDFGSADGDELVAWEFDHAGPTRPGDRTLIYAAALQRIHTRRVGLVEARRQGPSQQTDPPNGGDG